jgi:predicted ATPase
VVVKLDSLTLKNFRAATDVKINISGKTDNRIITMIGLNESGKTTILEGLSLFPSSDKAAASIFQKIDPEVLAASLVPVHRTGVFTGRVRISATFSTEQSDLDEIAVLVKSAGMELDESRPIKTFTVSKEYEFKEGDYVKSSFGSTWGGIDVFVRRKKTEEFKKSELPKIGSKLREKSLWVKVSNALEAHLPNVVYFPNFVVNIPQKIYISKFAGEKPENSYYRRVIEHILDDSGLSLQTHVLDRISKFKKGAKGKVWISELGASDERDKIDAIFSRLSAIITQEVLGGWSKVFKRPISSTRIDVRWAVDPENEEPFVEIKVSDGRSSFHLRQRSLGFRWFFSFLLFTRFGRDIKRTNLFLFDEPAANLHAKAQGELLSSFQKLADAGDHVIYSTHSHHMINPDWLSGAYIVENEAIDYEDDERSGTKDNNIKVTPYRRFVGQNGSRVSYFQPVLERLQYVEPSIASIGPQILMEGASDFYAFSYAIKRSDRAGKVQIVPGTGSGSLDTMIQIALSRGVQFLVILDDDEAGRKARERYQRLFYLSEKEVVTLSDLDASLSGKRLEDLLSKETRAKVVTAFGNSEKKSIGNYLAEICAKNTDKGLSEQTQKKLNAIIEEASKRLGL